ncbi:putative membrane protein [Chlamydia psittaci 04DC42]|uniref:Membrane protein n=1 Tax=Chlamydia psittaci 99DC5 TaxID=1112251 RepID=A0ABP2X3G5_CHLPS|nr:putative membrane protein [Chlamydia psittaci C19/98]AEG86351.1 putative membrane protein [Chlamydia psittaci 01DC11]AEG87325.1 putative membrane protein [Chlamydia psittaci 02DC15]AFS19346.1 putative membrane protein [Chlamydia psittaci 84/55]AFS20445.1 putative membrane protein [Chlamydia psittaci GR9]AFS22540.1 putative membrane protein [Chlamydia psittaci VS225]AFS24695.1 putative membrane protein [Chlamydia psittaci M56]EPJ13108.1 putative membrane protein [Chlamydia psittaci 02DC16]
MELVKNFLIIREFFISFLASAWCCWIFSAKRMRDRLIKNHGLF